MNAFKVKIFDADGTKSISVGKASFCIGSAKSCDIVLAHPTVQNEHVRVWFEGGRLWIQDLGSQSSTTLNDMKLPALKPMLCREIDTLKLGECPVTISIEPSFVVRPPQVKASEPKAQAKSQDNPDVDARKAELANASRELADLRLQLQMARLEKGAVDEIKKVREGLQEEIKALEEKKSHMNHEMDEWQKDKVTFRKNLDKELADLRLRTVEELKQMRESEVKKFEVWRRDSVNEMNNLAMMLMDRRLRPLVGKNLGDANVEQLEKEITQILRRILLNETAAEESLIKELYNYNPQDTRRAKQFWRQTVMGMMAGVTIMTLAVYGWQYMAKRPVQRQIASTKSSEEIFVEKVKRDNQRAKYEPKMSKGYKKSYTDNVLFTLGYSELEQSAQYRQQWILELNRIAVSDWKLSENVVVPLVAKELTLIQDLSRIKTGIHPKREQEGISKMRAREGEFQTDLRTLLKSKDLIDRFQKLKRNFYAKNSNLSVASGKEQK